MTYHSNIYIEELRPIKNYQKNSLKKQIVYTAKKFDGIDLADLGQVKLLNRVDTKFTFGLDKLCLLYTSDAADDW
mgnify:CR=1 FL=1